MEPIGTVGTPFVGYPVWSRDQGILLRRSNNSAGSLGEGVAGEPCRQRGQLRQMGRGGSTNLGPLRREGVWYGQGSVALLWHVKGSGL